MKFILVLLLVMLLVIGCADNSCTRDLKFKEFYFQNIDCLNSFHKDSTNGVRMLVKSACILGELTGRKPQYRLGYKTTYPPELKKQDIQYYTDWYEKNKCTYTYDKSLEIMCKNN